MSTKTHINVHHSANFADSEQEKQFDVINRSHQSRWNGQTLSQLGFYGGYHYLVERDGEIRQFRKEEEVGAHNNIQMMNYKAIGICFAGNMSQQDLSQAQIDSGLRLIKEVQAKYGIPNENVKPHRHYKSTQCWGMRLPADQIVEYLESQSQGNSPAPESQESNPIRVHRSISDWAMEAVEAAKNAEIATQWEDPQQVVGNSDLENILKNLGLLNSLEGNVTKERLITALYRLEKKKNEFPAKKISR